MMKRRQVHLSICLSALLIASVGTAFLTQPAAPGQIPQAKTPAVSSGAASSNAYHAAADLNQPISRETPNGAGTQRTAILLPEEASRERVSLSASDFEQRKPAPPGTLSLHQNTDFVNQLPHKKGETDTSSSDEENGGGIPPATDVPTGEPNSSEPTPGKGDSIPSESSSEVGSDPGADVSSEFNPSSDDVQEGPSSQADAGSVDEPSSEKEGGQNETGSSSDEGDDLEGNVSSAALEEF